MTSSATLPKNSPEAPPAVGADDDEIRTLSRQIANRLGRGTLDQFDDRRESDRTRRSGHRVELTTRLSTFFGESRLERTAVRGDHPMQQSARGPHA